MKLYHNLHYKSHFLRIPGKIISHSTIRIEPMNESIGLISVTASTCYHWEWNKDRHIVTLRLHTRYAVSRAVLACHPSSKYRLRKRRLTQNARLTVIKKFFVLKGMVDRKNNNDIWTVNKYLFSYDYISRRVIPLYGTKQNIPSSVNKNRVLYYILNTLITFLSLLC